MVELDWFERLRLRFQGDYIIQKNWCQAGGVTCVVGCKLDCQSFHEQNIKRSIRIDKDMIKYQGTFY